MATSMTMPSMMMPDVEGMPEAAGAGPAREAGGRTAVHYPASQPFSGHRRETSIELARRLARLKGDAFAGTFDATAPYRDKLYLVPEQTLLVGADVATGLIRDEHDLFGGLVPHAFVATKAITHPLVSPDAAAPEGWVPGFADAVRGVTLEGYTAFRIADARAAARTLIAHGPVRIKAPLGDGGHGQKVIRAEDEIDRALAASENDDLARCGLVLEEELTDVITFSIGRFRAGDIAGAYWGIQTATPDNKCGIAYGGSALQVVRGDFDELLGAWDDGVTHLAGRPVSAAAARRALEYALVYDAAADTHFRGFIASRRNYDVVCGRDAAGREKIGVLEQSWRLGGASGAEIAALEVFAGDEGLTTVRAVCVEHYGTECEPPAGAMVYFDGDDPQEGPLMKYALIDTDTIEARPDAQ